MSELQERLTLLRRYTRSILNNDYIYKQMFVTIFVPHKHYLHTMIRYVTCFLNNPQSIPLVGQVSQYTMTVILPVLIMIVRGDIFSGINSRKSNYQ